MKGFKLLFAVLLAPLVFRHAVADDASEIARAATRRDTAPAPQTTRQKSTTAELKLLNTTPAASYSRTPDITSNTPTSVRERATTNQNIAARTTAPTQTKNVIKRTTTGNVGTRTNSATPRATITRVATPPRSTQTVRTPNRNVPTNRNRDTSLSRAALTAPEIISRDYTKCRETFYGCMDEFCANKDAQLKRCACSSRINEFGKTQQMLDAAEDKLLDFGQRLLTVNLDKEDAAAIHTATEGEIAYNQKDTSASKKMLDEIAKRLNTSFDDNAFNQSLAPISLSLEIDSAFDNIDSMRGASTTTKSGPALHAAALPICREMAAEICSPEELSIAESGYKMLIEQDCNTVAKSYQAKTDQARERVFESGALLDMSRLDIHQKRNSDDILTCKNKMLTMLTDSTVCGSDMGKCLDTSGRYIDPTTGTAFLTPELAQLSTLITRPTSGQTWTNAPNNQRFVTFLESKKKFLEPAMENCQDISEYVWDSFIEDALSQIKLAQEQKLEDVRQSCTTLTAQCYSDTLKSITDLDGRALSIFGVSADKTAKAMCEDVINTCSAVLQTTGDGETTKNPWLDGATDIMNETTYATILHTCREVGRACIIQVCTSITGNFGLCENIDTSINRKSIINRTACWDEVYECIANAGVDTVNAILKAQGRTELSATAGDIYTQLYGNGAIRNDAVTTASDETEPQTPIPVEDLCKGCGGIGEDCGVCRLTEQIWGNCEYAPNTDISNKDATNRILEMDQNDKNETLLSWFARNTGTSKIDDNCRDTSCGAGYKQDINGLCQDTSTLDSTGNVCVAPNQIFKVTDDINNCCLQDRIDKFDNCCQNTNTKIQNLIQYQSGKFISESTDNKICIPSSSAQYTIVAANDNYTIICLGATNVDNKTQYFPSGQNINCSGKFVVINNTTGNYNPIVSDAIKIPDQSGNYNTIVSDVIDVPDQYYINTDETEVDITDDAENWHIKYTN